jgi:hypothetical protein
VTDPELDAAYTRLCNVMTSLGEPEATLFLARFALLAITHIDDTQAVTRLIDDAAEDLLPTPRD